ncbi:MAG: CoA ester lyase [Arenibacterium sp.]
MWRSLLFVPVLNDHLVRGASQRGADAVVLDLEAAVPVQRKDEARDLLARIAGDLQAAGTQVAVRVNLFENGGEKDIVAACEAGASAIVLPQAMPQTVERAARNVGRETPLIPLIESPRGVIDALAVAEAAPSVIALGFGVEDYAADMGAPPTPELLTHAAFQVIQAARAAEREPLVFADTIADFKNLTRFETAALAARAMGASGGFAIHPGQVEILNRIHTPSAAEVRKAQAILDAAEAARREGRAIATVEGQMIDQPVEARARRILSRAARQGA